MLFEIAYRKDQGYIAIYGIESLAIAIFTLFLPYIIFELDQNHKKYYLLVSIYITVYYILKSIYIAMRTRNKYMNNISDVKEIVKKEKTEKRKVKEDTEKKRETKKDVKENKEETKSKKRGRPKKETTSKEVRENKEEKIETKRRGRPKKTENKKVK